VAILDFDLASANPEGVMRSHCGTENYIAPEISHTKGNYGPKVDMWSLGIVVLEAIRPMFMSNLGRNSEHKRYMLAVDNELRLLKRNTEFSQVEKDIIRGMLYATPARRLTAARCLELGCENGLFRKSDLGDFIYEAGDAVPLDAASITVGQPLATIDEHTNDDGLAEADIPAKSCYNIASEATTRQGSGNATPHATGGSTPLAHERVNAIGGEDEDTSEYFPASSGSRAPMHRLWSELFQHREPPQTYAIAEAASPTPDRSPEIPNLDESESSYEIISAGTTDDPAQAAIDPLPPTHYNERRPICDAKTIPEPQIVKRRPDPAENPRFIAVLNDLREHREKKKLNSKRRAPEYDAHHILETQVVPAKKIKSLPKYPSWYNGLWTPDKGVTK
jgi:serine/threonine protein kinase